MKAKTLLVAAAMILVFSAAAYAQATFTVGSTPVTAVTRTGQTERAGDITFTIVPGSGTTAANGTITVTYSVPLTILPTISSTSTILATILAANTSYSPGQVTITVPSGASSGSFTLTGARVAIANTGVSNVTASISGVNTAFTAGQTSVVVINAIADGLASVAATSVQVSAVSGTPSGGITLKATEGYLNAFGSPTDPGTTTPPGGIMVRFTLTSAPPAGMILTFPATAATTGSSTGFTAPTWAFTDSTGAASSTFTLTSTSSPLSVYYRLNSPSDSSAIETINVQGITVTYSSGTAFPLPAGQLQFTASLAPIGVGLTGTPPAPPSTGNYVPRFVAAEVGPATFLTITGSNTVMLIPFASTVASSGYNTGIAIANTTTDPGSSVTGITGAIKQSGSITFYFYPLQIGSTAPTPFSYTTSASSPGSGLDSTGRVASGSTYSVLLSQLLSAALAPADFSGYIIAVTGFTNGHCQYIITDFKAFANGGQAMIIKSDRSATPEGLDH